MASKEHMMSRAAAHIVSLVSTCSLVFRIARAKGVKCPSTKFPYIYNISLSKYRCSGGWGTCLGFVRHFGESESKAIYTKIHKLYDVIHR